MADFDPSVFDNPQEVGESVPEIPSGTLRPTTYGPSSPGATPADKKEFIGNADNPLKQGDTALQPKTAERYGLKSGDQYKYEGKIYTYADTPAARVGNVIDVYHPPKEGFGPSVFDSPQQIGKPEQKTEVSANAAHLDPAAFDVPIQPGATPTPSEDKDAPEGRTERAMGLLAKGISKGAQAYGQATQSQPQPAAFQYHPPQVPMSQGNPVTPIPVSAPPFNRSATGQLYPEPSSVTAGTQQHNPFTGAVASTTPAISANAIATAMALMENQKSMGLNQLGRILNPINQQAAQRLAPMTSEQGVSTLPILAVPGAAEGQAAMMAGGIPENFRQTQQQSGTGAAISGASMDIIGALMLARSGRFGSAASDAVQGLLERTNSGLAQAAKQYDLGKAIATAKPPKQTEPAPPQQAQFPPSGVGNEAFTVDYGEGEVMPGTGKSAKQWQQVGQERLHQWLAGDMRHDPYAALSRGSGDPADIALVSAEHNRLLNNAAAAEQAGLPDWQEKAQQAYDFANRVQVLKGVPSDAFRAMQSVRQSRFDSLVDFDRAVREAQAGNGLTPEQRALFKPMAKEIEKSLKGEMEALNEGLDSSKYPEIAKAKTISLAEANNMISEQISRLVEPCNL